MPAVNIKTHGTTKATPLSPGANYSSPGLSGVAPAPSVESLNDDHRRGMRRWFIGPMPEKFVTPEVVSRKYKWRRDSHGEEDDVFSAERLPRERLLHYFLREGGQEKDWGEEAESSIREEIKRKWQESEWYRVWNTDKKNKVAGNWVGSSFMVGDVLGLGDDRICDPMLSNADTRGDISGPSSSVDRSTIHSGPRPQPTLHPSTTETFFSAESEITDVFDTQDRVNSPDPEQGLPESNGLTIDEGSNPIESSTTALIHTENYNDRPDAFNRAISDGIVGLPGVNSDGRPDIFSAYTDGHAGKAGLRSALKSAVDRKGKRKSVNFDGDLPLSQVEEHVAPPMEVLARTGAEVQDTSAGASDARQGIHASLGPRDVIMKDRMLVKLSYNRSEGLPHPYDEAEARRHPDSEEEDWAEFLVVWRHHHLEIYEDHSIPGKEWILGTKHLAFIVPLRKGQSRISLYSPVDGTFCITCPPTPVRKGKSGQLDPIPSKRSIFHRAPSGTNIFVFKLKSRSRAIDWMWHIWMELGGTIPPSVEVHSPDLGSRVKLDIPELNMNGGGDGYEIFTRDFVVDACRGSLHAIKDWELLVERELRRGVKLELCWRRMTRLDWIWLYNDIDDNPRHWAILWNVAFRQAKNPSRLEIRRAQHASTKVRLKDGTILSEPPSIEGYVHRIKQNTQARSSLYLSSHDGNLFTLQLSRAHPPRPPAPPDKSDECMDLLEDKPKTAEEQRRAAQQILSSDGYIDLRSIFAVRRAETAIVPLEVSFSDTPGKIPGLNSNDDLDDIDEEDIQATTSDEEDVGGETGLNNATDKAKLRLRRMFELVMRSGLVVRFEAHSCTGAIDWISKLKALISYWTRRHRVDARQEMDIALAGTARSHWTAEGIPDAQANSPYLGGFWNWCIIDGCRPIIKAGRLFSARGVHKQLKHKYHVLTHGHLVQFHITSAKSSHHHRSKTISLIDAYVFSGQLAVASLPHGVSEGSPYEGTPKRYQDGLEAEDSEEDVTFIIWYRPHTSGIPEMITNEVGQTELKTDSVKLPSLGTAHRVMLLKARSKLERDAWCFALNCEIERLARSTVSRERRLRDTGNIS